MCNDEWRGLVLFGLYIGQRIGDLAKLTWRAVNLEIVLAKLLVVAFCICLICVVVSGAAVRAIALVIAVRSDSRSFSAASAAR